MHIRECLKKKKRIVIKIGSSSLTHTATGDLNLRNEGKDVVLVSSGAVAIGRKSVGILENTINSSVKQACAAIGQAKLMMVYQKLFAEYGQTPAQILMTKDTMLNTISRKNARNTFEELFHMRVIPIVNENDTVSTDEIEFGDNDTLSAIVTALIDADLLILLSDIDGLYTDNPRVNLNAEFITTVERIDEKILGMAKGAGSKFGTGGMATKISAARIANDSGADMIVANGEKVSILRQILDGENCGTIFLAHKNPEFYLMDYITTKQYQKEEK